VNSAIEWTASDTVSRVSVEEISEDSDFSRNFPTTCCLLYDVGTVAIEYIPRINMKKKKKSVLLYKGAGLVAQQEIKVTTGLSDSSWRNLKIYGLVAEPTHLGPTSGIRKYYTRQEADSIIALIKKMKGEE
jgi:hypothetical protein